MEKNLQQFIFSMTAGECSSVDDFNVEFFDYNEELDCDGEPVKVVTNFGELLTLLDREWEE
jgi:hypothetical protein